jgi:hypothetical protein
MISVEFVDACPTDKRKEVMQYLTVPEATLSQSKVFVTVEKASAKSEKQSLPFKNSKHQKAIF